MDFEIKFSNQNKTRTKNKKYSPLLPILFCTRSSRLAKRRRVVEWMNEPTTMESMNEWNQGTRKGKQQRHIRRFPSEVAPFFLLPSCRCVLLPSFQRGRRGFPPVTIIILPWIDEEIEIERFSNESVSSFTEFRLFLNEDLGSGTDSGTWKGSSVTHFGFLLKVGPLFYFNQKKRHLIGGNAPASVQFPQHWHCWVMEEKKILIQHFFMKPLFLSPFPRDCPAGLVENYKQKSFEPINKMLIGSITGSDGDAVRLWLERERCRFLFTFIDSSILQSLCERWLCRVLLDFTES